MPEIVDNQDNNNSNPPNPAPAATQAEGDNSDKRFDINTLPEEAWSEIFKHKRFSELIDAKNELKQIKSELRKKEEEDLTKKGEYEKLAKQREEERDRVIEENRKLKLNTAIEKIAGKAGAVDSEAVLALIDHNKISVDESTGEIRGVDEAVAELQSSKPYLFGKGANASVGNPTNPANPNTGKRYKLSQLQNAQFYRENEADILLASKEGRIEDDLVH